MKIHDVKILTDYFEEVVNGNKKFEFRKNDRGYELYDILILREIDEKRNYTGRATVVEITFVLKCKEFFDYCPQDLDRYEIYSIAPVALLRNDVEVGKPKVYGGQE